MLSPEQLEARRHRVGASDVAKICGMSKWGGPLKVWAEKVQGIYEPSGEAASLGSRLEPVILDWAQDYGLVLASRGVEWFDGDINKYGFPLAVTLDARTHDAEPVNAKTSGLTGGSTEEWGEAETDVIPTEYIIQEQAEMLATGADIAFVPALIARRGFVMFRVNRNNDLIESIKENCAKFWRDYVMTKTPPPPDEDNPPDEWLLKNLKREPNSVVELPHEAIYAYEQMQERKSEIRRLSDEEGQRKAFILSHLGLAEAGRLPDGRLITFYETERKGYTVEACKYRTLKITKG